VSDGTFQERAQAWLNGTLDGPGHERLQNELRESAECREEFVRLTHLDAGLRDLGAGGEPERVWSARAPAPSQPTWRWPVLFGLAAAALFMAVLLAFHAIPRQGVQAAEPESMGQGFAVLTREVDARWNTGELSAGDVIPRGAVRLLSGLAQIEFFNGAAVVLEGPGELEIRSASEAYCRRGKLRVSVPPAARGFVIETPEGRLVDLGTEFGLEVGGEGSPAVHVFEGKVRWQHSAGPAREIGQGEAVRGEEAFSARSRDFVGAGDLDDQLVESNDLRYDRWRRDSRELRRDPRLIAYYPMDQPGKWNRRLVNEAPTGSEMDGAIVGAKRVEGRWDGTGKSALQFTPTGSRVRLFLPGEYTSLTFACWVRIDSLDRQYNALYLTDNYQPGEPHWQLGEDGRILFSILVRPGHNLKSWSPPVWDLSRSGRWMHLAAVFDEPKQEIRHYANGERILRDPVPKRFEIHRTRFGAGEIGNWGLPTRPDNSRFAIRNLNGRIDEFALFAAALTDDEISQMFTKGRPQ